MTHEFVGLSAYFPKRILVFGAMRVGHFGPRYVSKTDVRTILDFARTVQVAGGFFYIDNKKYRYVKSPECVLRDGFINPLTLQSDLDAARADAERTRAARSEARTARVGGEGRESSKGFTCLVTRKVSLTGETGETKSLGLDTGIGG